MIDAVFGKMIVISCTSIRKNESISDQSLPVDSSVIVVIDKTFLQAVSAGSFRVHF